MFDFFGVPSSPEEAYKARRRAQARWNQLLHCYFYLWRTAAYQSLVAARLVWLLECIDSEEAFVLEQALEADPCERAWFLPANEQEEP